MKKYFDKNNNEIKAGMTIKWDDGSTELIYQSTNGDGDLDIGINASNERWLERTGYNREIYPLSEFILTEVEIIEEK